jgi:hypothetical protein
MKNELIGLAKAVAVFGVILVINNEIGKRMWSNEYAAKRCAKQDAKRNAK